MSEVTPEGEQQEIPENPEDGTPDEDDAGESADNG
jgi:hypothetical protein